MRSSGREKSQWPASREALKRSKGLHALVTLAAEGEDDGDDGAATEGTLAIGTRSGREPCGEGGVDTGCTERLSEDTCSTFLSWTRNTTTALTSMAINSTKVLMSHNLDRGVGGGRSTTDIRLNFSKCETVRCDGVHEGGKKALK